MLRAINIFNVLVDVVEERELDGIQDDCLQEQDGEDKLSCLS